MNVNTDAKPEFLSEKIPHLRQVHLSAEQEAKIREQIKKGKTLNDGATLEISKEGWEMSSQNTNRVIETKPLGRQIRELERTGYESIDNPILDALEGQSDEVKDLVYDIVRNDFLRSNTSGMSEQERQDAISLGLAEAKYIADNYMDAGNAKSFMSAMTKVANIASAGVQNADGTMDYGLPNSRGNRDEKGHTVETTDTVGMMKAYSPETYAEYQAKMDEFSETGDLNKAIDGMRIMLRFVVETAKKDPGAVNRYEKGVHQRVNNTSTDKLSRAFADIETNDTVTFLDAIRERQNRNSYLPNTYWEQKMTMLQHFFR